MGRPEERKVRENDRNRIKLGALFAPIRLTSPCKARRRGSQSASAGDGLVLKCGFSAWLSLEIGAYSGIDGI